MKTCSKCNVIIPLERLEILPNTQTCVNCSTEKRKIVFNVYDHKTAPSLVIIAGEDEEAIRLATRAHFRAR